MNIEILALCEVGSKLYGTNTPTSDKDYKGVYKASMREIFFGEVKDTITKNTKSSSENRRNSFDDVDTEFKELRKFVFDCLNGQIYCYDLLFSTENSTIQSSQIWQDLILNREKLLSSNVVPLIGFCRKLASKYSIKGSRLNELEGLLAFLSTKSPELKMSEVVSSIKSSEFIKVSEKSINVLGKTYYLNNTVQYLKEQIEKALSKFSTRSKIAAGTGGYDYKAISHAFRGIFQAKQLLSEGFISFPLRNADFLLQIKLGQIDGEKLVILLDKELDSIGNFIDSTLLPQEPDRLFWKNWLCEVYGI